MFKRLPLLLLLTGLVRLSAAQTVFIPDLNLRNWLNSAKPLSVDASGYCDTAAWNASPPNLVTCSTNALPNGATVNLQGLQFLKMLRLAFDGNAANTVNILWAGYPQATTFLEIEDVDVNSFSGGLFPLSDSLETFICDSCGLQLIPDFQGWQLIMDNLDLGGNVLTVPPSVTKLHLINCQLTELPLMPNVTVLAVDHNPLTELNDLPDGLLQLMASYTELIDLPTLPSGLNVLSVSNNQISTLPPLPVTLEALYANYNLLTDLPVLPPGLETLSIAYNDIPVLPTLPTSLRILSVSGTLITEIPPLAGLAELNWVTAAYTNISAVPPLPDGVSMLTVTGCTLLTCLPPLPDGLGQLRATGTGITCLPNMPTYLNLMFSSFDFDPVVCTVVNTLCPLVDPLIIGTTFNDLNVNGTLDGFDTPRPYSTVIAQPGDLLTGSDMNGRYVLPADIGSFLLDGVPVLYRPVTTSPYAVTFSALGQVDSLNNVGTTEIPGMYDLSVQVNSSVVRPGFFAYLWITVQNVGTVASSAQVQLTVDGAQDYTSSTVVPDQVNGNLVDWNVPALAPGVSWQTMVTVYTPNNVAPGVLVVQQAIATPDQSDQTPLNNTAVQNEVVVSSYDPNDKRVQPALLSTDEVALGERVEYTVRFQNTGTYMAERVIITDTLDASGLQVSSMELLAHSHPCTWYIHHGVLHVLFNNINLPDSNSNESGSHGFVRFSFRPSIALTIGSSVSNVANIYFDFNEPVITNAAIFEVEGSTTVHELHAGPLVAWVDDHGDQLTLTAPEGLNTMLTIIDMAGRTVLTGQMQGTRTTLTVSGLSPGVYQVIGYVSDHIRTARFVKN